MILVGLYCEMNFTIAALIWSSSWGSSVQGISALGGNYVVPVCHLFQGKFLTVVRVSRRFLELLTEGKISNLAETVVDKWTEFYLDHLPINSSQSVKNVTLKIGQIKLNFKISKLY